jgi:cysteine sulfinate desulfinase/cysteine desulfurase-like protein
VRLSLGRATTTADVQASARALAEAWRAAGR